MRIFAAFLIFSLFVFGAGVKPAPTMASGDRTRPVLSTEQVFWSWYHATNPLQEVPASYSVNKEFWTWYLQKMPPEDIKVKATCRGIGQNLYVFVNDVDWERPVTQADVDKIIEVFDRSTPGNPHKGIYRIATEVFGPPPDKDGDPKIYILISELGEFRGHHFDGFFRYIDQTDEKGSNQLDILYVDAHDPSSEYHLGVLAHEFQHLIHWRYDPEEAGWVNEALSEVCMILCGYYTDKRHVESFLKRPDRPLVADGHGATSYGACLLWATYIYDRLGSEFLGKWVRDPAQGVEGFESAIKNMAVGAGVKPAPTFNTLFADWMVALYLNNPEVEDGIYAYKSLSLPFGPYCENITSYPVERESEVNGYGIDYIKFSLSASDRLKVTVKGDSPNLLIKVIEPNKEKPSLTKVSERHASTEGVDILVGNSEVIGREKSAKADLAREREVILAITVLEEIEKPVKYRFTASLEEAIQGRGLETMMAPIGLGNGK
ncbi:MAG TPA: hypothetical protein ACFYEM_00845 [Candidatus Hypogeohydataceae bacterium YC40]